jgi:hypothetical protein
MTETACGPKCVYFPVHLYPAPPEIEPSKRYTVRVNGLDCFVYPANLSFDENDATKRGSYAYFDFRTRAVHVRVESTVDITSASVRPLRHGIEPRKTGARTLEFDIAPSIDPTHLVIEINGNEPDEPLYLFAGPMQDFPTKADPTVHAVFGAGTLYQAGQNGITKSGDLVVPPGKKIVIEGGAVVRARIVVGATSATGTGSQGCQVLGRGVVDTSALPQPGSNMTLFGKPFRCYKGRSVLVDGPIFIGAQTWGFRVFGSDTVKVNNAKIFNGLPGTPDGLDVMASKNVTVQNTFIRSYDDAIAVKNEKDSMDGDWSGPVSGIKVWKCVLWNGNAGNVLEIGWETGGYETGKTGNYIRNVLFEDIDIVNKTAKPKTNRRAALSIHNADGTGPGQDQGHGMVSNITYRNIRVERCSENYVNIWNGDKSNITEGVLFDNVVFMDEERRLAFRIDGTSEQFKVSDVEFRNVRVDGELITGPAPTDTVKFADADFTAGST